MNNKKIAKEILLIAKELMGGTLDVPPKLLEDISEWVDGYKAVNEAIYHNDRIKNLLPLGDDFSDAVEESREELKKYVEEAKSVGVPLKRWSKVSKKFKVDLSGWKYNRELKDAEHIDEANRKYGVITVELINGFTRGNTGADWDSRNSKMRVTLTGVGDAYEKIKHELIHWAQYYMDEALGVDGFGKPKKRFRDNTEEYHISDEEFYPLVSDTIRRVERKGGGRAEIDSMLGIGDELAGYKPEKMVMVLKSKNKRKWKKLADLVYRNFGIF